MRKTSAFTLIELLIVIAIIGILMGLLFPAVNGATNAARKAQAKNDVTQIATAVIAYETEYGKLPITTEPAQDVAGDLVKTLGGSNVGNSLNPRQIVFIEINGSKKNKSGTNSSGTFVDPWNQPYKIKIDHDYDNNISDVPGANAAASGTLRKKVVVWGIGIPTKGTDKEKTPYTANSDATKFVKSWD